MKRFLLLTAMVVGCSSSSSADDDPDYEFARSDVEAALAGNWSGSFTTGRTGTVALSIALAPATQTKCGSRTLSTKCIDITGSNLTGTITTSDNELKDARLSGSLMIMGTKFNNGELNLKTGDGLEVIANYSNGGLAGQIEFPSGTASFTLTRAK